MGAAHSGCSVESLACPCAWIRDHEGSQVFVRPSSDRSRSHHFCSHLTSCPLPAQRLDLTTSCALRPWHWPLGLAWADWGSLPQVTRGSFQLAFVEPTLCNTGKMFPCLLFQYPSVWEQRGPGAQMTPKMRGAGTCSVSPCSTQAPPKLYLLPRSLSFPLAAPWGMGGPTVGTARVTCAPDVGGEREGGHLSVKMKSPSLSTGTFCRLLIWENSLLLCCPEESDKVFRVKKKLHFSTLPLLPKQSSTPLRNSKVWFQRTGSTPFPGWASLPCHILGQLGGFGGWGQVQQVDAEKFSSQGSGGPGEGRQTGVAHLFPSLNSYNSTSFPTFSGLCEFKCVHSTQF